MKTNYILCVCLIFLATCTKKQQSVSINAGLKANFGFKAGTYWVYKDSITGRIDSFIVSNVTDAYKTNYMTGGTAFQDEEMYITMTDYKNEDSIGLWYFYLESNGMAISFKYNDDTPVNFDYALFSYPIKINGTVPFNPYDTGIVINIYPSFLLNSQSYINTALILHMSHPLSTIMPHNDQYYVNDSVGIIKMTLNYPPDSIYRVMELQNYKIIK